MRTFVWIIGGTVLLALQVGLAPRLEIWGARPDWLLVAVVFFALHVRAGNAAAGAWCLGFAADLLTLERPGMLAITYTATALLVAGLREYVFRMSAMTQFFVVFAVGLLVRGAWLMYRQVAYDVAASLVTQIGGDVVWGAVYTALFAPPMHRLLMGMGKPMGMRFPRYSHAGMGKR